MPPGPAYNWLCVLHTSADILSNVLRYKAAQLSPHLLDAPCVRNQRRVEPAVPPRQEPAERNLQDQTIRSVGALGVRNALPETIPFVSLETAQSRRPVVVDIPEPVPSREPETQVDIPATSPAMPEHASPAAAITEPEPPMDASSPTPMPARVLLSSTVPSSRIGRLFHYGGLAASLGYGAATELLRRTGQTDGESQGSLIMTEANIRRLVSKLSQMRGAALKLGQFLSIQDTHMLPPDVDAIFRRVQDSAHYMPDWQLQQTLSSTLGPDWESTYFTSFDHIPFAAASIGQVHSAILNSASSPTQSPTPVAVKVQFPNIRNSIESDLGYVRMLLTASRILPRGMFLERTVEVMKEELADECSYEREAGSLRLFGSKEFLGEDKRFKVPWVWEGSTDTVLVMEKVEGVSVGEAMRLGLNQQDRNDIAAAIIELCLRELFEFRTMQTDPNWTNFLWNQNTRQIELVDFGATRTYTKDFMDNWLRLLQAAASEDDEACKEWSLKLGYLTGEENEIMLNAHITSMKLLATPFRPSASRPFAFGPHSMWADITKEIRTFIPVMLQHRLTPPPRETYSLNRKLSGAYLLATRLDAEVDAKGIWDKVVDRYEFS